MFATGETVGLAEWIDDTCLVMLKKLLFSQGVSRRTYICLYVRPSGNQTT